MEHIINLVKKSLISNYSEWFYTENDSSVRLIYALSNRKIIVLTWSCHLNFYIEGHYKNIFTKEDRDNIYPFAEKCCKLHRDMNVAKREAAIEKVEMANRLIVDRGISELLDTLKGDEDGK